MSLRRYQYHHRVEGGPWSADTFEELEACFKDNTIDIPGCPFIGDIVFVLESGDLFFVGPCGLILMGTQTSEHQVETSKTEAERLRSRGISSATAVNGEVRMSAEDAASISRLRHRRDGRRRDL